MQIDVGFGDGIVPGPTEVEYPTMLDFPAPVLQAYPRETVIAEKLEALTKLGLLNGRMKDYYDLALLSRMYSFEGEILIEAIAATFRHRGTRIEAEPVGLTDAFYADPARAIQWRALLGPQRERCEFADTRRSSEGPQDRLRANHSDQSAQGRKMEGFPPASHLSRRVLLEHKRMRNIETIREVLQSRPLELPAGLHGSLRAAL